MSVLDEHYQAAVYYTRALGDNSVGDNSAEGTICLRSMTTIRDTLGHLSE